MKSRFKYNSGAVSIFMVIFAMLVVTIITVGFLRHMLADLRQAGDNDLSQSAYDSALAGVEDAKRALLLYQRTCNTSPASCTAEKTRVASAQCNEAVRPIVGGASTEGEVPIQSTVGGNNDEKLDQAYTCVTITPDTADYLKNVAANESQVIPLRGVSNFDTVRISWFSREDDVKNATGVVDRVNSTPANMGLLRQSAWPEDRPSLLRAQFMQTGSASFSLSDFDTETSDGKSNANTVFLFPTSRTAGAVDALVDVDGRRVGSDEYPTPASDGSAPLAASCRASVASGGYACTATLLLPTAVGQNNLERNAFLRLTPFYKASAIKVELLNGGSVVNFDGVQPAVDSTGRANSLFRRVLARVDMMGTDAFPFPEAAVDLTGNFCKDFTVTEDVYIAGTCTP